MNNTVGMSEIPPFEGPEKKIQMDFVTSSQNPFGMRSVSIEKWKALLSVINCSILSAIKNEYCDAYVLSESSLFVFSSKVIIKTCGQITLLKCLDLILEYARSVGATESKVAFSRRNFFFPDRQMFPHTSFEDEVACLKRFFPEGDPYMFGPHSCDHHFVFVWHNKDLPVNKETHCVEILMTGLDKNVMRRFFKDDSFVSTEELTQRTGIRSLFSKNAIVDAHAFDPCGFSLNTLEEDMYYTLHITPQPECSFVSFETNCRLGSVHNLVERVVNMFKPESFTVLIVSDSVPFEKEAFPYYVPRGVAHHDFVANADVLTWYSFRACGTASPHLIPRRVVAHYLAEQNLSEGCLLASVEVQ